MSDERIFLLQREEFPWEEPDRRRTAEEMFEAEDKKKEVQAGMTDT